MTDFGGKLRHARERRGVSLRQVAASTKISVAALDALERNDLSKLPGGIFTRAFVRSYAIEVGLNPDETVKEFLERAGEHGAGHDAYAAGSLAEDSASIERRQRKAAMLVKIIVAGFVAAAVILYFTWRQIDAARRSLPSNQPSLSAPGPAPTRGASL